MLPENCFLFDRNDVASLQGSKLFGYGITDDAVIIGSNGLNEYAASGKTTIPDEGRFCGIFFSGTDEVVVKTDITGQELLYYYQNEDYWAVSNSFLLLAQKASTQGKLNAYTPAILGFHLRKGSHIGEQLLSHRTTVAEIRIVPLTSEIRIDRKSLKLRLVSRSYLNVFSLNRVGSYADGVIALLEQGSGLIGAFSEAGFPTNLFLSGGYDSRLALCMALGNKDADARLRVTSFKDKLGDFQVATSICERLGLKLNTPGPSRKRVLSSSDALRTYLLSCGGTYLPMYPVHSHFVQDNAELRVTGDQPTSWDFFVGNGIFNGSAQRICTNINQQMSTREIGGVVGREFMSTFDDLDVDPKHPAAMIAYYSAIRSRHHCGRSWNRSLGVEFLLTPLTQPLFVALDIHNTVHGRSRQQLFADVFTAFGGWALEEAFETKKHAFSQEMLDQSPFNGGIEIKPKAYRVFGRLQNFERDQADLFSLDLDFHPHLDRIKEHVAHLFLNAEAAKASNFFTQEDFDRAKQEIHTAASLSHHYRATCHIISTDLVLKLIRESGN